MDAGFLEHLIRMYQGVQDIESSVEPGCDSRRLRSSIEELRALAMDAPPGLKEMRPSIPWERLQALRLKGNDSIGFAFRELVPMVKNAVLAEFGLESGTLVHSGRTGYSYAAIFDSLMDGKPVRCLFLDGILSSAEHPDGSPALFYPSFVIRSFGLLKNPERALVLGVAGGTIIEVLKGAFPNIHVDGVDIDGDAITLGKRFFSLKEDARTKLHECDAREFIQKSADKYDIAVMDAFAGISPVPHLATVEFAHEMKSRLTQGGICAINIIAKVERGGYLQYAYDTWRSAFSNVLVFPLCREGELFNVILVATDADTRAFEERNYGDIYAMEFDPKRVLTDANNRIRELSPY
jgi:hypothetical protein